MSSPNKIFPSRRPRANLRNVVWIYAGFYEASTYEPGLVPSCRSSQPLLCSRGAEVLTEMEAARQQAVHQFMQLGTQWWGDFVTFLD